MESQNLNTSEWKVFRKWMERFYASEGYSTEFFNRGKENYKLYKSFKDSGQKVYKHDIFVPYTFAYVEDFVAFMMLSIMASPVLYSLEPRINRVTKELCLELEQILHCFLVEESAEFALEIEELIKNASIFNVSYLVNYPTTKQRKIISLDGEATTVNNFNGLHLDAPHPLDMYVEPMVKRLSRMNWIIKRSREDFDVLKRLELKGEYTGVTEGLRGSFSEDDPAAKLLQEIGLDPKYKAYDEKTNQVEILDCMEDGHVITIAGRQAFIRDTTKGRVKPFLFKFPILDCRTSGAPGEFFGIGTAESIKPTQEELNMIRSQRRDNISLLLNKVFTFDMMAGEIDWNTFFSAPGNVIMGINLKEALDTLEIPDVTASAFKESDELRYDLQNITDLWDYARGATPRRRETATGIIRLQQAAQGRNEWVLRKIDFQILQPLCIRLLVYLREYLSRDDYNEIVGKDRDGMNHAEEFYSLDPEKIRRSFHVMPMTESIVSIKEVNMNQFLQAFDRLIQVPEVNRVALVRQLLQKFGQQNIKEVLPMLSNQGQELFQTGLEEMEEQGRRRSPGMPLEGVQPMEGQ